MPDFLKNFKILIIDDFAQFRQTIKAMVMRLGALDIDQSSNSSKALKLCMENDYDIILSDYNLGEGQNGQQFLEELHERKILIKGVLFLMVTAETTSIQVMAAIEYRPDSYLTKPFTNEELGQRLNRLIKKNKKLKPLHDAFNSKQYAKALALCDSTIEAEPNSKFSCLRIKSELFEVLKKHSEALELFEDVASQQPLLWAILGIGKVYFNQGDIEKALEHFQQMHNNFPQQVNVLDWIAKCQKALGNNDQAEQSLLAAIQISPKSLRRQVELGEIAQSLQHDDIAHHAFEKVISQGHHSCLLKPEHYQHYYDATQSVVEKASKMTQARVLATTESLAKRMESKYQTNPSALAGNLSSLAQLFSTVGKTSQSETFLSKMSTTLDKPNCRISDEQFKNIESNLKKLEEKNGESRILDKLSTRMDGLKDEIVVQKENDLSAITLNRQGMDLAKNKHLTDALEKFRGAIKLSPNNPSYLLNASQVILFNDNFRGQSDMVAEARNYLSTISIETSGTYWRLFKKISANLPDEN